MKPTGVCNVFVSDLVFYHVKTEKVLGSFHRHFGLILHCSLSTDIIFTILQTYNLESIFISILWGRQLLIVAVQKQIFDNSFPTQRGKKNDIFIFDWVNL